ncbi:MAG: glycosyltransferase [Anaerolineae bacterium]
MRVLLFAFGSRGDVQPFVALAKGLQRAGYEVALAAGVNYGAWIQSEGVAFEALPFDIQAMVNSDVGVNWIDGKRTTPLDELRSMKKMAEQPAAAIADLIVSLIDRYDVFISGALTLDALRAAAQARGKKLVAGLMSPWAPTRSGAAGMQAPLPNTTSILNYAMGYLIEAMMFNVLYAPSREVRQRFHLPPPSRSEYMRTWNRTPALIGVSPLVMPPPRDWESHLHVTGYWFLDTPEGWEPPAPLTAFLEAGEPPVYMGFGSMSSRNPESTLRLLLEGVARSGQRAVIHSGGAGLAADALPPTVYMLDSAPHEWLFPRMAAIIHHGGAGTTAAGLRSGRPSAVISHVGDQPYWGRRIHALKVGAAPVTRSALTVDKLSGMIRELTTDRGLQERARDFGERLRAEDGVGNAVRAFQQIVNTA